MEYKHRKLWTIARAGLMITVLLAILRADSAGRADRLREARHA